MKGYWDPKLNSNVVQILPGQYYVTNKEEYITTVLGSCISVCLRDPISNIGGMNHFMLPGDEIVKGKHDDIARFGTHAMEMLINDLLKMGANKKLLVAKVIGGGSMFKSEQGVGIRNAEFAREFLRLEGFPIEGEDVGSEFSRKVRFNPVSGKVAVKKLRSLHNKHVLESEKTFAKTMLEQPADEDDELFG